MSRRFTRFEEKETDVALGIQLVESALLGAFGVLVLVSGDSDLVPARAPPATLRRRSACSSKLTADAGDRVAGIDPGLPGMFVVSQP